jgi:hypothetical protein
MLSVKDILTSSQRADHEQATMQRVLLMQGKQKKREAADIAAGRLVRIAFHPNGALAATGLYPARVAAFVCKVLGQPINRGIRFVITTQGSQHSATYDTKKAELAVLALLSRARAEQKFIARRMARQLAAERRTAQR